MFRTLLTACLIAATALPALALPDRHDDKERRKEWKEDRKEDRRYWKEHDRREREYWKTRKGDHHAHRYDEDRDHDRGHDHDRDHGRGRRHVAPPWMSGYWRPGETRRYVALVPGDPSRMYVFLEGRWVLRQVRDPRARLDLDGAFHLPMAPPPIAPPRIGLDLHVVLFN